MAEHKSRPERSHFQRYRRNRSKSLGDPLDRDDQTRKSFSRRISHEGLNGFDELRKFIKQGNVFCQEVGAIMQERSDLENNYAKALSKLSAKLSKAAAGCLGTMASSWTMVASEMETQSELHRTLGQALHDDIYKNLKQLAEQQHKARKPVEGTVDKALKSFIDKRADEAKAKKLAFTSAKEREKLCDQLHNAKAGKGKAMSDKDISKLEKKVRSLGDTIQKADKEYHSIGQVAEQHRQQWETAVYKGSGQLQSLEEERIYHMQDMLNKYNSHLSVLGPKYIQSCDRLGEAVLNINVTEDVQLAIESKGTGPNQPEQLLLDYFAEDVSNTMDKERRKQCLTNYLIYIQQDLDREKKGREGLERLIDVYQNRPSFSDSDTQEETRQRLSQMSATTHFLEACQWKIASAISNLTNRHPPDYAYSQYIERTKDKSGCMVSILRLPVSVLTGGFIPPPPEGTLHHANPPSNGIDDNFVQRYQRRRSTGSSMSSIASRTSTREQSLALRRLTMNSTRKSAAPMAPPPAPLQQPPDYGEIYPAAGGGTSRSLSMPNGDGHVFDDDDDEFDNYDDQPSPVVLGSCRAIYDYTAQHYDELSIKAGDIISIHYKQDDGWWQGDFQGKQGIFPATYVEELGAMV